MVLGSKGTQIQTTFVHHSQQNSQLRFPPHWRTHRRNRQGRKRQTLSPLTDSNALVCNGTLDVCSQERYKFAGISGVMTHDNRIYQYLSRLFVIYLPKNVVVWLAMFWFSRLGAHNNFYFENRLDSHGCVQNPNHASHVSVCSWCDFWRDFFLGWKSSHLQLGMFLCLRSIMQDIFRKAYIYLDFSYWQATEYSMPVCHFSCWIQP